MLVTVLVETAVGLVWIGATALAMRKWGRIGLLGVPIGSVLILAGWAALLGMACAQGNCP